MPIGSELTRLLARLNAGEQLTQGEMDMIAQRLDLMDNQAAQQAAWMDEFGNLSPNLFKTFTPPQGFTSGPMDSAMLFQGGAGGEQVIAAGFWTIITAWDDPKVLDAGSTASHELGNFETDAANGKIKVLGFPREAKLQIYASVGIPYRADITSFGLMWSADDGSQRVVMMDPPWTSDNDGFLIQLNHRRTVPSAQTEYVIKVRHNSATDLTLPVFSCLFSVTRTR